MNLLYIIFISVSLNGQTVGRLDWGDLVPYNTCVEVGRAISLEIAEGNSGYKIRHSCVPVKVWVPPKEKYTGTRWSA